MGEKIKKVGLLTGGGDCPGLNAAHSIGVCRAVWIMAFQSLGFPMALRGFWKINLFLSI